MSAAGKPTSSALDDACFAWTWIAILQTLLIYIFSFFWGGVHVLVVSYVALLLVNAAICLIHSLFESRSRNQASVQGHRPLYRRPQGPTGIARRVGLGIRVQICHVSISRADRC